MKAMPKQKTSIIIDRDLWKEWTIFVIKKTGSARKLSEELEKAIKEYMQKHKWIFSIKSKKRAPKSQNSGNNKFFELLEKLEE